MRSRVVAAPALTILVTAGLTAGTAASDAATRADTTVTIKAEGTDLSGKVKSPRPKRCADGRKVVVIKQVGARGGGNDIWFASDTASLQGDVYRWSTGNTGTEGRFYAKVKRTEGCKGDTSRTIRAVRS
jgi:hypothetical protein